MLAIKFSNNKNIKSINKKKNGFRYALGKGMVTFVKQVDRKR